MWPQINKNEYTTKSHAFFLKTFENVCTDLDFEKLPAWRDRHLSGLMACSYADPNVCPYVHTYKGIGKVIRISSDRQKINHFFRGSQP